MIVAGAMTAPFSSVKLAQPPTTPIMITTDRKPTIWKRRSEEFVLIGCIA